MTGDKFIPELHLKQPGFTYSVCGPFAENVERNQKLWQTGNLKHLYRSELDEACLAHDAIYSDSDDLAKTTISEKILKDRAYEIAKNSGYDEHQRALASMVNKLFRKKGSFIRDIRTKFGVCNSPQSPDIGQNSYGGIFVFRIFGQSLIKENCQNSRSSDDIDMKLEPVTRIDKRNKKS